VDAVWLIDNEYLCGGSTLVEAALINICLTEVIIQVEFIGWLVCPYCRTDGLINGRDWSCLEIRADGRKASLCEMTWNVCRWASCVFSLTTLLPYQKRMPWLWLSSSPSFSLDLSSCLCDCILRLLRSSILYLQFLMDLQTTDTT
jgi:hypothetical protein